MCAFGDCDVRHLTRCGGGGGEAPAESTGSKRKFKLHQKTSVTTAHGNRDTNGGRGGDEGGEGGEGVSKSAGKESGAVCAVQQKARDEAAEEAHYYDSDCAGIEGCRDEGCPWCDEQFQYRKMWDREDAEEEARREAWDESVFSGAHTSCQMCGVGCEEYGGRVMAGEYACGCHYR